jgi:hypothetical protein
LIIRDYYPVFITNDLSFIIKIINRMRHHHHLNFYDNEPYPVLSDDQRATSIIEMQKQIQQLLTTRNDLIARKDEIGTDFQINTDFYADIDYQTPYKADDLINSVYTPASMQGLEYKQYSYKR